MLYLKIIRAILLLIVLAFTGVKVFKQFKDKEQQAFLECKSLPEIQKIEDKDDFRYELSSYILIKSKNGDKLNRLSKQERVLYVIDVCDMEVNNGGFDQYFFNSSGDQCNELVPALTEVKAFETAKICEKALNAFGCKIPSNRAKRNDLMDELESDSFTEKLNECDNEYYSNEENVNELIYSYVMENKKAFGMK